MRIGHTRFVKGYSSRLLINEVRGVVGRYGWGNAAGKLNRNWEWLMQAHQFVSVPKPLRRRQFGPLIFTSESYVEGQPLTATDVTGDLVKRIIAALAPVYRRYAQPRQKTVVTLIHGDLTYRNVITSTVGPYFIDGDRSVVAPPEFDVWLLLADSIAHSHGRGSHAEFIQQVWRTSPEETPYREAVEKLYELVPTAQENRRQWLRLWQVFTVRCLTHSIADCLRRGKSLDWLDGLA